MNKRSLSGTIAGGSGRLTANNVGVKGLSGSVSSRNAISSTLSDSNSFGGSVSPNANLSGGISNAGGMNGYVSTSAIYTTEGGYYIPSVDDGELTWKASKDNMPAVPSAHIAGKDGKDGIDGKDGYTPVKNKDYFDGLPGKDGQNGQPGKDGTSPVVSISAIEGGHRINITDTSGTKTVDVMDGSDGKNGSNGQDGNGIKSAILNDDYTLTLTFDDGTRYTTPSIRGATGEPGVPGQQGIQGIPGEPGQDGKSGVDGITPHIGDNGNWFIGDTDTGKPSRGNDGLPGKDGSDGSPGKDGQSGQDGKDGADGYTPQRGKDYWTAADVSEMVKKAVAEVLKIVAPGSIGFGNGKLYAPATSASYSATKVTDDSVTFQYRGGSGVEELLFPITGLTVGRTYTIKFDETYNGGYIQDTYRYGCGIIQKSVYDSTTFPTNAAKPTWIAWHTGSTGKQSGEITFKAESNTVYWAWSLGRLSDGVFTTIVFNAYLY